MQQCLGNCSVTMSSRDTIHLGVKFLAGDTMLAGKGTHLKSKSWLPVGKLQLRGWIWADSLKFTVLQLDILAAVLMICWYQEVPMICLFLVVFYSSRVSLSHSSPSSHQGHVLSCLSCAPCDSLLFPVKSSTFFISDAADTLPLPVFSLLPTSLFIPCLFVHRPQTFQTITWEPEEGWPGRVFWWAGVRGGPAADQAAVWAVSGEGLSEGLNLVC